MKTIIRELEGKYDTEDVHSIDGISPTLRAYGGGTSGSTKLIMEYTTVAYSKSTRDTHIDVRGRINADANTISTGDGGANMSTQNFVCNEEFKIRKLTPVECERLMGWPDNWTKYGKQENGAVYELSDSARYKACGNGIVSSVPKAILESLIPQGEVKMVSTFSGVDGSTLSLPERFKKLAFCEFDPETKQQHAANVLRYRYPTVPNLGDITKVLPEQVPDHDLLFISAPCQTFSAAGKRAGLSDTKGTLFYETARILEAKKPKYFLFENVKGLLSHDKGRTFEIMCEVYSSLGYEIDFEVVNAKYFGVPQNRERIFMFGRLR